MINGFVITAVGMIVVFAFLTVLVLAMRLLRVVAVQFGAGSPATENATESTRLAAIAVAAIKAHRAKGGAR